MLKKNMLKLFSLIVMVTILTMGNSIVYAEAENKIVANDGKGSESIRVWESNYKTDDYNKYTTPASENKLDGTLLKISGKVIEEHDITNSKAWIIQQDTGEKWAVAFTPEYEIPAESVTVGDELTCFGVYAGISRKLDDLPTMYLVRYISSKEEYVFLAFAILHEKDVSKDEVTAFENDSLHILTKLKIADFKEKAYEYFPDIPEFGVYAELGEEYAQSEKKTGFTYTYEYASKTDVKAILEKYKKFMVSIGYKYSAIKSSGYKFTSRKWEISVIDQGEKLKRFLVLIQPVTGDLADIVATVESKKEEAIANPTDRATLQLYLEKNYNIVTTVAGRMDLSFTVLYNESVNSPYDYVINVSYDHLAVYKFIDSNKYTYSQKNQFRSQMKTHMETIANDIIQKMPGEKITGSYSYYYYRYPHIKEDLVYYQDYLWTNYGDVSALSKYADTKATDKITFIKYNKRYFEN